MRIKVLVNDGYLDLPPDVDNSFYITKSVHDIHNLETREGDYSRTIFVPYTDNNIFLLGDEVPELTRHAGRGTRFVPCMVLFDDIPVLEDARLRVEQGNKLGFTVTFFNGVVDFFNQLSDRGINELNWGDLDFVWNIATLQTISKNTSGLAFANSHWFDNASIRELKAEQLIDAREWIELINFRFSGFFVYVRETLNRIFSQLIGLTVDWSQIDTAQLLDTMAYPCTMSALYEQGVEPEGYYGRANSEEGFQVGLSGLQDAKVTMIAITETAISLTNSEWIVPEDQTAEVNFQGNVTIRGNAGQPFSGGGVYLMLNDDVIAEQVFSAGATGVSTRDVNLSFEGALATSNRVWVRARMINNVTLNSAITFNDQSIFQIEAGASGTNQPIQVSKYIPEIAQIDFVKGIINQLNLIVTERDGIVTFRQWDAIVEAEPIIKDRNIARTFTESGIITGYGRTNIFRYLPFETVTTYRGTLFTIDVAADAQEVVKIELPYTSTDQSELGPDRNSILAYTIRRIVRTDIITNPQVGRVVTESAHGFRIGDVIITDVANTRVRMSVTQLVSNTEALVDQVVGIQPAWPVWHYYRQDRNPGPIMQLTQLFVQPGGYYIVHDANRTLTGANAMQASFPASMTFANLMSSYFKNLVNSLKMPYRLTAWFDLTILEFIEMDQLRPIYLPEFGASFYVNIMEQYKPNNSVRIELIQVGASQTFAPSELRLQGAYSSAFSNDFNNLTEQETN